MPLANSAALGIDADTIRATLHALPPPHPDSLRGSGQVQDAKQRRNLAHYLTRPLLQFGPLAFAAAVLGVLAYAWSVRDEGYWTAENGFGYALGIAGSGMMLAICLYPLRKRFRALSFLGRVGDLFRLHMVLGILGPTLIILHCNFKLGSMNSRLALMTMLIVVVSGIVGRYLYSQVHRGLYGRRAEARDILADVEALKRQLGLDVAGSGAVFSALEGLNGAASQASQSSFSALASALTIGFRVRSVQRRFMREASHAIRRIAKLNGWSRRERRNQVAIFRLHARTYFAAIKKAERLALFERLFALWHVLHMPLFIMLVTSVIFHVVAVHQY
jgi:hypothetical protein